MTSIICRDVATEDNRFGLNRMTKKKIVELCKKQKLYITPYLNDVLYLHFQGFDKIECLEEYIGLKCLWLESNAISLISGLTNQRDLRCLFLQNNLIKKIENLENCTNLDTINVSHNYITTIENCAFDVLPVLNTLNISHNQLRTCASVEILTKCINLSILDLSHNRLDDVMLLGILAKMPELRVLVLTGNPVVNQIPSYRKTIIVECKKLTYLDSRPVFDVDRACAEAWRRGGYEEEQRERERWRKEERRKIRHSVNATLALRKMRSGESVHELLLSSSEDEDAGETTSSTSESNNNLPTDIQKIDNISRCKKCDSRFCKYIGLEDQCNNNTDPIPIETNEEILQNAIKIFDEVSDITPQNTLYASEHECLKNDSKRKSTENSTKELPIEEIIATKRPLIEHISSELVEEILEKAYPAVICEPDGQPEMLKTSNITDLNPIPIPIERREGPREKLLPPKSIELKALKAESKTETAMNNCAKIYQELIMESIERIPPNNYRAKLQVSPLEEPRKILIEEIVDNVQARKIVGMPVLIDLAESNKYCGKETKISEVSLPIVQDVIPIKAVGCDKLVKSPMKLIIDDCLVQDGIPIKVAVDSDKIVQPQSTVIIDEAIEISKLKSVYSEENNSSSEIASKASIAKVENRETDDQIKGGVDNDGTVFKHPLSDNGPAEKRQTDIASALTEIDTKIDEENKVTDLSTPVKAACENSVQSSSDLVVSIVESSTPVYISQTPEQSFIEYSLFKQQMDELVSIQDTTKADETMSLTFDTTVANYDSTDTQPFLDSIECQPENKEDTIYEGSDNQDFGGTATRGITFYCENTEKLLHSSTNCPSNKDAFFNTIDEVEEEIDEIHPDESKRDDVNNANVDEIIEEEFDGDVFHDCLSEYGTEGIENRF